jgi:GNAT superfamily N-acetyltransferase/mRNA-degrading endonuclease HigB of HigAB toxin-antitoxin module
VVDDLAPSSDYELRNYQPGDEVQINSLFNAAFGKNSVFTPRSLDFWVWRYLEMPGFDPKGVFLLEERGRIVSSVIETLRKAKLGEKVFNLGVIDDVSTQPGLWGRGLASKLLEESIKYAEQKNLDGLTLYADPEGHAHKIYLKYGFVDAKTFHFYIKTLSQNESLIGKRKGKEKNSGGVLELLTKENLKDYAEKFNEAHTRLEAFYPLSLDVLNWRLFESEKAFPSQTWILRSNQEIVGGGTLRIREIVAFGSNVKTALLEYMFTTKPKDTSNAKVILSKLLEEARKKNCAMALCIISSNCDFESKFLESSGFSKVSEDIQMIKPLSKFDFSQSTKHCWYAPYEHMIG